MTDKGNKDGKPWWMHVRPGVSTGGQKDPSKWFYKIGLSFTFDEVSSFFKKIFKKK